MAEEFGPGHNVEAFTDSSGTPASAGRCYTQDNTKQ